MKSNAHTHAGRGLLTTGAALAVALVPCLGFAQAEVPAADAPVPAASAEPAPTAVAAPAVTVAQVTPTDPAAPAVSVAETTPPAAPKDADPSAKPLSVSVWGRIGNILQSAKDPKKIDDLSQNAEVDLLMSGQIHKYVKWQANFVASYGPTNGGDAAILDLIGQLEFADAFNVWFGRMLVPSDRSNFSGPWFMSPWNYPGFFPGLGAPVGPRQGPFGRNDGATVWGQFGGGLLKYYAGVFDLRDVSGTPLFSGRINLSLLNPEPGFYHSSTYYGGKDVLAIGLGAQYKKDGSAFTPMPVEGMPAPAPMTDDYTGFFVDALFEKNLGGAGTIDVEGAFQVYTGDYEIVKNHYYGLLSYLLPVEMGIGKLQPLVRYQGATPKADGEDAWRMIDAQLGYVITDYAARVALGYQNSKAGTLEGNAVFLGLQLQK